MLRAVVAKTVSSRSATSRYSCKESITKSQPKKKASAVVRWSIRRLGKKRRRENGPELGESERKIHLFS